MNLAALLDGLGAQAASAIRPLLQQAYDRGFREGLASAGVSPDSPAPSPSPSPIASPTAAAAPLTWRDDDDYEDGVAVPGSGGAPPAGPSPVVWSDMEDDEGAPEDATAPKATASRPIHAVATIGTLRERIVKSFALERFDIDIVVCRRGDPSRRQLKSSVRLSKYAVDR